MQGKQPRLRDQVRAVIRVDHYSINAWLCGMPERQRRCVRQQPLVTRATSQAKLGGVSKVQLK
jgi:hypothetical protein